MNAKQGVFIVIEGVDGSGKGTQFELLRDRLIQAGYDVETFDFPQYSNPSSHFVKEYLNGAYGTADQVGPYTSSLFYALDRFQAASKMRAAIQSGKVVIANRFTGSNMAHQGTKFSNPEERRGYFIWLDNLEFEMLRIPRPDINFVLRVPADIAQSLVDQKAKRAYTDKKRDIHEADLSHLKRAVDVYDDLCQLFPNDFQRIDCVRSGKMLDVETIQAMLWEKISPLLPPPSQLEIQMPLPEIESPVAETTEEATEENPADDQPQIAAQDYLTSTTGQVYAFTSKLNPTLAAAAMATLGRNSGNLNIKALEAFAIAAEKDEQLVKKTLSTIPNPATKQLISQYIVTNGVSHLAARTIERGRLATYVESSIRHTRYEQKDSSDSYKYFTPTNLDKPTSSAYKQHLEAIFANYAAMLPKLAEYIASQDGTDQNESIIQARGILNAVLPVAATITVGTYADAQAIEQLHKRLSRSDLAENQQLGKAIIEEVRKNIPEFIQDGSDPQSAHHAQTQAAVKTIAQNYLPETHSAETDNVQLTDVWPHNELDLTADMLYEHSSLPLNTIRSELAAWPYSRKLDVFEAYIGQRQSQQDKPGRALEKVHYSWDITCEYAVFSQLQRHRIVDDLEWQPLTPRYGYEVPAIIEAAGLADHFETCFDISLKLYSLLQQAGYLAEAQYATLFGHRTRWKVTYNARQALYIHELRSSPKANPATQKLIKAMHAKLAEVHPLLAESIQFVGK
ncbi:MAG TPA: FAD-dependent thymidylate synthase [Patescibacteria group bacterium]|nr:FAD-dependent thymidylate synthase [Patescibacteria group bacterium]